MREIKFRGIARETNEFVYGYYYHNEYSNSPCIKKTANKNELWIYKMIEIYPETLGQYIGLKDSKGKEIYEGDKIMSIIGKRYECEYNCSGFVGRDKDGLCIPMDEIGLTKVIGTIHDGKYGMSEEDKKILEAHIQILKGIQGALRNLGLNYKTVDVNSVIGCINDAMSAIYEIKEVKE